MSTAFAFLLMATVIGQDKSTVPLSVCDVLAEPLKYNGRLVTIRGVSQGTGEGWWIGAGKPCTSPVVTNGYTRPSVIWVESIVGPQVSRKIDFQTDRSAIQRIDRQVREERIDPKLDVIWLTFTGLFETREFTAKDTGEGPGVRRAFGFGHMNTAPGQLLLKTVVDLYVERGAGRHQ